MVADGRGPRPGAVERLGILGGTFDPVHVAHLVAALEVQHALDLDRVLLVVAGAPWQKEGRVMAPAGVRLAMVEAATADLEGIKASDLEVRRPGSTYTAETLDALATPGRELFLIAGADVVDGLDTWHRVDDIRARVVLVVVERGGECRVEPPGPGWRVERVTIPRLDISSSDIRHRVAQGRPIDFLVPAAAVRVLRAASLYTRLDDPGS